jgi:hypothetical protein
VEAAARVHPHSPQPADVESAPENVESAPENPKRNFRYIRWWELLRRVLGIEVVCARCKTPLRLISLIKSEPIAKKILVAMHLPSDAPELHPARPPPEDHGASRVEEDYLN